MPNLSSPLSSRIFRSRWFLVANCLLIVLVGFSFVRERIHSHDIAGQIAALQKQSQSLQAENFALAELKNIVQTESYAEQEARLKLALKKPGESLVILKNEKTKKVTNDEFGYVSTNQRKEIKEQGAGDKTSLANATKWWYYFFAKQAYQEAE